MVNSNSKSRSAVENSSDAPTPNIYKYTATLKFLLGEENHDIDFYSIKSIVIDRNYKEMNMPMIFITASINRKVVDLMVQNQKTGSVILDMKRCIYNSDMPDLYEDYIVEKFTYFISDDINKNDKQDFEGENEGREDLFVLTTFGLLCIDHINKNKKVINGVMTGKLSSLMYYMTSHLPILIEPPANNVKMNNIYIPPMNSVSKGLEYLNSLQVFYNSPYVFFIDFDCSYLLSTEGKVVPRKGDKIKSVLITLKNSYDEASKIQGMILDTEQSICKIDVDGIDAELSDNHISDKIYSKVVATKTSGSSSDMQLAKQGDLITPKTRAIRVSNENTGLLNNMKASIEHGAIQMLVQKTDVDASVFTINKEYTIKADEVYGNSDYNGKWLLIRKRELYIREDDNFTMSIMLLFEKL